MMTVKYYDLVIQGRDPFSAEIAYIKKKYFYSDKQNIKNGYYYPLICTTIYINKHIFENIEI